ncbi:MAG: hypothetical protein R3358_04760 [Woeseiaceae bacterium]|nr:hypothetical protein [Woeseiaceae bacterium]
MKQLIIAALALTLQACVIAPIPLPSKTHVERFDSADIRFIEEGETSREETWGKLGAPDWQFEAPTRWVYQMRKYTGGRWNLCGAVIMPEFADGGCGSLSEGETRFKLLELVFDEDGVVADEKTSRISRGECTRSNLCLTRAGDLVPATEMGSKVAQR